MAICGIANTNGIPDQGAPLVDAMVSALHDGEPAAHSAGSGEGASLGCTSSVKTASLHSCSQLLLVCDAEIFNQQELRNGGSTVQRSDSLADLMAELYLRYGDEFVQRLRGVFSVGVWDKREQKLLLLRDRFGV